MPVEANTLIESKPKISSICQPLRFEVENTRVMKTDRNLFLSIAYWVVRPQQIYVSFRTLRNYTSRTEIHEPEYQFAERAEAAQVSRHDEGHIAQLTNAPSLRD